MILVDSGFSRHMTGKKEYLKDYRKLDNAREVKFGNNKNCSIKGYRKIMN